MTDFLMMIGGAVFAMVVSGIANYRKSTWQGLTDEEQQELYDAWVQMNDGWGSFYALIEAKLKEKNT